MNSLPYNVRLNLFRVIMTINVWTLTPIFLQSIFFKVLAIVYPVVLVITWVPPFLKISGLWHYIIRFVILPKCSLSVFESILLSSCSYHISVLECPLVRTSSRISRSNNTIKTFWEVIHLQVEVRKPIHPVNLFWIRHFSPNNLRLLRRQIS